MLKLGIVMDDIASIKPWKDSSFAMLLEAQRRNYEIFYMLLDDLFLDNEKPMANMRPLSVVDQKQDYFHFNGKAQTRLLTDLDVILMRKDPPFDMEYIYATYILEQAEIQGKTLVVNKPGSLRDANEKLFTLHFPQCIAPTRVSRNAAQIKDFLQQHKQAIIKPLGGMGGTSIFKLDVGDVNTNVIIETLTAHGSQYTMIQQYLPEIRDGDKRILLIDGQPIDYALARIPATGEHRGNIAAGGQGKGVALSQRDYWLCQQIAETLKTKGLIFVGIDVIGDYITEINVTSPTCIRELDSQFGLNIAAQLMDTIEKKCR